MRHVLGDCVYELDTFLNTFRLKHVIEVFIILAQFYSVDFSQKVDTTTGDILPLVDITAGCMLQRTNTSAC